MARSRRTAEAGRQLDLVVSTNVYADLYRTLQDISESRYSTPRSQDPLAPGEVQRRATLSLLDVVSNEIAAEWRLFDPTPDIWKGHTAGAARQDLLLLLEDQFNVNAAEHETQARTSLDMAYASENRYGKMGRTYDKAAEAGLQEGHDVVSEAFACLHNDNPKTTQPGVCRAQSAAIRSAWTTVCQQVKKHIPETAELTPDPQELYTLASLDIAQRVLVDAFTLMQQAGARSAPSFRYAGAVLTEIGIPQPYVNSEPEDNEGQSGSKPCSGYFAETPKGLQMREVILVCEHIADGIATGALQMRIDRRFNQLAKKAFDPRHQTYATPEEWIVALNSSSTSAPAITEAMRVKAADATDALFQGVTDRLYKRMKSYDGWVKQRKKPQALAEEAEFGNYPAGMRVIPHTNQLQ